MRRILSSDEKRFVCEMVRDELALGQSLSSILKVINDTMGIKSNEVYKWNKDFNMIFKNNLISEEDKIIMCEIVSEKVLFGINLGLAVREVAEHFNIEKHAIYRWNKEFNIFNTMTIFDDKKKIEVCKKVEADRLSNMDVATSVRNNALRVGVDVHTIYNWNRKFKIFKVRDYDIRTSMYSDEFISSVLKDFVEVGGGEKNVREIAKKYSISTTTVYTWRREKIHLLNDKQR